MATDGTSLNTTNGVVTDVYNATQKQETKKAGGEMGKEAFLQLLVTQMEYQDPLDPQDNAEYIAQLAQFSSLEQMTNLNTAMELLGNLVVNIDSSVLVGQLSGFIDKEVTWTTTDEKGVKTNHTGKVTAVKLVNGNPSIIAREKNADGTYSDKTTPVDIRTLTGIGNVEDLNKGEDTEDKEDTAEKK